MTPPLFIYVSTPLTLDVQFWTNLHASLTNYGTTTAVCMWTHEIKTKTKNKNNKIKSRHIQVDHSLYCSIYPTNNVMVSLEDDFIVLNQS